VVERSPADLEADWKDLAGDSKAGYAALARLVSASGPAVEFLGKKLQSVEPIDCKRIERLIAALDDNRFQVREQASQSLMVLAERAEPALRKALGAKPSLETRRRVEGLLDRLEAANPLPETLQQIRAVEALELVGNAEARKILDKLASDSGETRLADEARAAARRLGKRGLGAP
jgi:HEAT repeat protein